MDDPDAREVVGRQPGWASGFPANLPTDVSTVKRLDPTQLAVGAQPSKNNSAGDSYGGLTTGYLAEVQD